MNQILQFLKKNGEQLDAEIAAAAGLSLSETRNCISQLAAKGEVMAYHSTRFLEGQKIEGIRCRVSGFTPPSKPGRKAKAA